MEIKNYVRDGSEKRISDNTRDNWNRFIEFLEMHELREMNTWFQQPTYKLVTYKEKLPQHNPERPEYEGGTTGPFVHTKCAQCDFLLKREKTAPPSRTVKSELAAEKIQTITQSTRKSERV